MIIRRGGPDDAERIAALIAQFQPLLTTDPGGLGAADFLASVSSVAEAQYLASPRYVYLIAECDGEVAGFIAMRDVTHLFHLFVAVRHQRNGLARVLWQHARELAFRTRSPTSLTFTVNASHNAVEVYRAFGFQPTTGSRETEGIRFLPMQLAVAAATGPAQEAR